MLNVAIHHDSRQKAREIADAMDIPPRYLTQILANLVQAGLLTAVAGPAGGYSLARPADEITLLEVVEAAEGPIGLERCVLQGGPCSWEKSCPVHVPWASAQKAMAAQLDATTFADLAAAADAIDAGTYELPADAPPHVPPTRRRHRKGKDKKR